MTDVMEWTPQQARALDDIGRWLDDPTAPREFKLFGFAGTGKTTLARHIGQDRNVLYLAYTGKAASVLRKKGIPNARTIHSALYGVGEADQTRLQELHEALEAPRDDNHRKNLEAEIRVEKERVRAPRFFLNRENPVMQSADLIFIDECSMVNEKLKTDLEFFGKKILVSGDPFQLPPVFGTGVYMKGRADVMLTDIRRQELDNPIIRWSMMLRDRTLIPYGTSDCGLASKIPRKNASVEYLASAGQLLTGKNATRRLLNRQMRHVRGIDAEKDLWPKKGEPIIMLRNDAHLGVLNGVIAKMLNGAIPAEDCDALHAKILYEGLEMPIKLCPSQFRAYDPNPQDPAMIEDDPQARWKVAADFGYAITVHKSQGSQWENVCLVDDGFNKGRTEDRFRWQYTAITRAEKSVRIVG